MKKMLFIKVLFTSILLFWMTACRTPADPAGVTTKARFTIDTGGFCRDLAVNDSLIVAAADENGYQTYRYQLTPDSILFELIDGVNDIDSDGAPDRLWQVEITDKINGNEYPLFFSLDNGDAIFYQNVASPSAFNARVPADGSANREKVRGFTVDMSSQESVILYVIKESDNTNTNFISIRKLDIQYDFFDSTIVFWGAQFDMYNPLNINSSDIYYSDSTVFVANSQLGIQTFQQLHNGGLVLKSEFDGIPGEVNEIFASNGLIVAGLSDDKGCYLALLDSNGQPTTNLRIADGYTVRGIDIYQDILALACGPDGVLLYKVQWSGNIISAVVSGVISTEYAYAIKIVSESCIFAGTRAGIEVAFIEL